MDNIGNAKTILIADDDRHNVEILNTIFTESGFSVITSYDGADAVNKAKITLPDIVILDIIMPKLNGIDVITELKKVFKNNMPKIIMLTVKETKLDKDFAQKVGADFYITKPFDTKELKSKVYELLNIYATSNIKK